MNTINTVHTPHRKIAIYTLLCSTILVVLGLFYWFELRPQIIEKDCSDSLLKAISEKVIDKDDYELFYKICVRSGGFEKARQALHK